MTMRPSPRTLRTSVERAWATTCAGVSLTRMNLSVQDRLIAFSGRMCVAIEVRITREVFSRLSTPRMLPVRDTSCDGDAQP